MSISRTTMDFLPFMYVFSFIYHRQYIYWTSLYEQHVGCLIRSKNCIPFTSIWVHLWVFFIGSVLLIFLVSCVLLCVFLFVWVLCLVCPILQVSLDSPFVIVPSGFSNTKWGNTEIWTWYFVCWTAQLL